MRTRWTQHRYRSVNRNFLDWDQYCDAQIARIIVVVADLYNVDPTWIVSNRKTRHVCEPRRVAMYLARAHTEASFPEIGAAFGNRHHSTIIAARDSVERNMEELGELIEEAEARLEAHG